MIIIIFCIKDQHVNIQVEILFKYFRSEYMLHKTIRIPLVSSHEIMNLLGRLDDAVEFEDLNKDNLEAKKNFMSMIIRCDEMEKRFLLFDKICLEHNIAFFKYDNYDQFIRDLSRDEGARHNKFGSTYFDLLEGEVLDNDKVITELLESYYQIRDNLSILIEKKAVFDRASTLILQQTSAALPQKSLEEGYHSDLNYIAGVAKAEDEIRMKRMIFRVSRGRASSTFYDFPQPGKKDKQQPLKKIFSIFFQSEENILFQKIIKICDLFNANRFVIPRPEELQYQTNVLNNDIIEKQKFLKEAENSIIEFITKETGDVRNLFLKKSIRKKNQDSTICIEYILEKRNKSTLI
jgi:V-type H+-transporting ATPase subunit a